MKNNIHVIYDKKGWKMKEESKEEEKHFNTKKEALEYSKNIAKKNKVELIIHNKNGIISKKDSYGNDKFPPKG